MHGALAGAAFAVLLGLSSAQAEDVVKFRVPGASDGLTKDLRAASLLLGAQREDISDPQDLFAAAQAEYGRLIGALYARGYYSPVISVLVDGREAAGIAPLDAPARIGRIEVSVEPGPPFVFGAAQVAPLARGTSLPEGFRRGARAESGLIRQAVDAGVDGWRAIGHAKARPSDQSIVADHAARTLSAQVTLSPGPRLRFGPLTIRGAERMRESRIRDIAGLPEGQVFDPEVLRRSAERLRRTGVFRSVTLAEDEAVTPPDLLGITATVAEELPRHYSFGGELASFEGLDLTGTWMHRNLMGGAERLAVKGEVRNIGAQNSGLDYSLGVTLDRPATLTPDTTLSFNVELAHLDEEDYVADKATLGFAFSHVFSDTLTGSAGLEYTALDVDDNGRSQTYRNLALPLGLIWDKRDDRLDATRGFYIDAGLKPFQGFGTSESGARVTLDARAYRGFGKDRPVVLAGRLQAGKILGASLLGTPRDDLFYSGGGGTVRGQPYQSLGVNVLRGFGDQFKTGGLTFLGLSAEVRTSVTERIGVVAFADAGYVGLSDFFDASGDWHSGAGLGLRYDTGFGPIRFDVAAPVSGNTGDGVQFYIGIGQAF